MGLSYSFFISSFSDSSVYLWSIEGSKSKSSKSFLNYSINLGSIKHILSLAFYFVKEGSKFFIQSFSFTIGL